MLICTCSIETTHPREGTETSGVARATQRREKQLIPARGRKPNRSGFGFRRQKKQLIPARGRKLPQSFSHLLIPSKQLIPARGRKLKTTSTPSGISSETTHPREGTETQKYPPLLMCFFETTHPREGTETRLGFQTDRRQRKQLIPARGRKPTIVARLTKRLGNNSSPRGDGNRRNTPHIDILVRNNSSPRGDGNVADSDELLAVCETTHPREGTETSVVGRSSGNMLKQLIPARGRKP